MFKLFRLLSATADPFLILLLVYFPYLSQGDKRVGCRNGDYQEEYPTPGRAGKISKRDMP